MRSWTDQRFVRFVLRRVSCLQLPEQMVPLVVHLTSLDSYLPALSGPHDSGAVKPIPPPLRLPQHFAQVAANIQDGIGTGTKPDQLRVGSVSFSPATQNLLSQQTFTPQSHQALPVQVLRMY
jgi:hypothetical protein